MWKSLYKKESRERKANKEILARKNKNKEGEREREPEQKRKEYVYTEKDFAEIFKNLAKYKSENT